MERDPEDFKNDLSTAVTRMSLKSFYKRRLFHQLSWKEVLTSWGIVVVVFLLLILYVFEITQFEKTLQVFELIKTSLLWGALFAGTGAFLYAQTIADFTERLKVFMFILILGLMFSPLFGSLINRLGSNSEPERKSYEIFEVKKISSADTGSQTLKSEQETFFVYFFENDQLERIKAKNLTEEPQKGDRISLKLYKGLFGWQWVEQ